MSTFLNFSTFIMFMSLKLAFILANSADPDEMPYSEWKGLTLNYIL